MSIPIMIFKYYEARLVIVEPLIRFGYYFSKLL